MINDLMLLEVVDLFMAAMAKSMTVRRKGPLGRMQRF
jgi:hypothetical protein